MSSREPGWQRPENEAYEERLGRERLTPLWHFFKEWFTGTPKTRSVPYLWRYEELRPLILESASVISAEDAERRVLVLENPGLPGEGLVTESLYAGLQLIMPGEVAPPHRHSPAALRFIIEGDGAYTAVNGERAYMHPGNFIVTPSWTWHEHGHDGDRPTIWMDVLDFPLIRFLGATFSEHYPDSHFPQVTPPGHSLYRYGMNMVPAEERSAVGASPVFAYPYVRAREVLEKLKQVGELDPCHGLKMEYIDPTRGGPAIPTISTFLQLLPAAFSTRPYRSTDAKVLCLVEGSGEIAVGEGDSCRTFAWAKRDICVVPPWQPIALSAREESVIFIASDRVVQSKLGIWRERRGDEAAGAP